MRRKVRVCAAALSALVARHDPVACWSMSVYYAALDLMAVVPARRLPSAAPRRNRTSLAHRIEQQDRVVLRRQRVLDRRPNLFVDVGRDPLLTRLFALIRELETVVHARGG